MPLKQNGIANLALAARLARFRGQTASELAAAAAISPRIAQLASSFPLLFRALVTGYGPEDNRAEAIGLTIAGAPLPRVAAAMGLPLCLRRLPVEAYPLSFSHFMWSADASRHLASLIPPDPFIARTWLCGVSYAARYGDEAIAIWIARQHRLFTGERTLPHFLLPIVLYAWHSRHRPALLQGWPPWNPALEIPEALFRTVAWLKIVKPYVDLDYWGVTDSWLPEGSFDEFHFTPLTRPRQLFIDALEMENCLLEYSEGIARNFCRLFRIERARQTIATMEVQVCKKSRHPIIIQILGPKNAECPVEVWHFAEQFVKQHARVITDQVLPPAVGASPRLNGILIDYRCSLPAVEHEWLEALPFWHLQRATLDIADIIGEKIPWKHWK